MNVDVAFAIIDGESHDTVPLSPTAGDEQVNPAPGVRLTNVIPAGMVSLRFVFDAVGCCRFSSLITHRP